MTPAGGDAVETSAAQPPDQPALEDARAIVSYCGEEYRLDPRRTFAIGREGDLIIDDNPFLHRRFLEMRLVDGLWWITNVGSRIAATIAEGSGMMQAWLGPGARLPLVFGSVTVVFTAGSTTYEFDVEIAGASFIQVGVTDATVGETTVGEMRFTPSQFLLILALAEPWLQHAGSGAMDIPSNSAAARRLGWTLTRFNRKLDNVADKLDRLGVQGMRGGPGTHATYRRARLVEYAVASQLVTRQDIHLLDEEYCRNTSSKHHD